MHALAFSSWFYLAFIAVGLPYGAINMARRTRSAAGPAAIPSRAQMHWNGVATHLLLFGISWYAGLLQGLRFLGPAAIASFDLLAGAAALALLGVMAWVSRAVRSEDERRRMWVLGFLPRTWREGVPYAALGAIAAVSEELTYRGVAFAMLTMVTGSAVAGALLSAALFAAAHVPQGGKSMGVIFVIGLIKQGLVIVTHTLWVAIAVHFAYNMLAAIRLRGRVLAADAAAFPSSWRTGTRRQ